MSVVLDESSLDGTGQDVTIPTLTSGGSVTIEITGITPGRFPAAASFAGVGFSEIDLGLGPTTEVIRVPTDGLDAVSGDTPLALVFTRWRTDPTDPWRADPEPTISRRFDLPDDRTFDAEVTLRLDQRATDALLADFLAPATSGAAPIATSRITGGVAQRGTAALDGDGSTSWVTGFDEAVGSSLQLPVSTALGSELIIDQPTGPFSTITDVRLRDGEDIVDLVGTRARCDGAQRDRTARRLRWIGDRRADHHRDHRTHDDRSSLRRSPDPPGSDRGDQRRRHRTRCRRPLGCDQPGVFRGLRVDRRPPRTGHVADHGG